MSEPRHLMDITEYEKEIRNLKKETDYLIIAKNKEIEHWKTLAILRGNAMSDLQDERDWWKRKAEQWLTAYQKSRVKHVGDYTRFFVRRPRMRRLIQFLMRL